ncbi:Tyrosine-protein kinase transmembrane receptor ROR2 [Orchesella cincta]|uniref:Tyrosine-protein kinase transmembrane receptor ROR2 n=1 Tax=Orchesella cincta TaxID=48709 RepID=A0A1D2NJ19_ORCCI|nr:Tyrosine-protein kinase transmembrane receptor ROR2 [Orchesella cincta]
MDGGGDGRPVVSWIRKKDLHILTSGSHIYTSDPRVSLLREGKLLNSWTLKLSSVQKKDLGQYECQVNTEPKMTITLYLIVLGSTDDEVQQGALALGMLDLPQHQRDSSLDTFSKGYEARILGPGHVQIHQGQTANLTCLVAHGGPSPNITWFLNDIPLLKTSNTRGGINIETERSPFATISKLVIVRADRRDEGKYSCGGITVYPDSVVLRVLPFHSRSEEESDEAVPMMVSVASSARVGAKPPFSSIHLDPSTIIITNRHHSFNKLLPTWTHFARQTTSIFFASFITYIFHYQAIHSLNAPAV